MTYGMLLSMVSWLAGTLLLHQKSQWLLAPTPLAKSCAFLDMILLQLVPVKSPCRTSARRFSSSYHVLATLSAVVLALKEGRTGLPTGQVFGAGKTRSAAVLLAGLLAKENFAAHAIAEDLVALQLLQEVQQLMGRLVGYYEQRRKGSGTPLDLPVENRNHHIRQKSLLTGCGGGFLMECGQPYSPVSDWIKQVNLPSCMFLS